MVISALAGVKPAAMTAAAATNAILSFGMSGITSLLKGFPRLSRRNGRPWVSKTLTATDRAAWKTGYHAYGLWQPTNGPGAPMETGQCPVPEIRALYDRFSRFLGRRGRAGDAGPSSRDPDAPGGATGGCPPDTVCGGRPRGPRGNKGGVPPATVCGGRPRGPRRRRAPLVMLQHHGAPRSSTLYHKRMVRVIVFSRLLGASAPLDDVPHRRRDASYPKDAKRRSHVPSYYDRGYLSAARRDGGASQAARDDAGGRGGVPRIP